MSRAETSILVVSQFYASHRGGLEIVAGHLVREWSEHGAHVSWAAAAVTEPSEELSRDGDAVPLSVWNITEDRLGIPFPLPGPQAVAALSRAIKRADAVVAHDSLYLTTLVSWLLARIYGKPFFVIQHIGHIAYRNPILRGLMGLANRIVARTVLARADQVFFISHNTAQYFSTVRFRNPPEIVFNGVDTATFRPVSSDERRRLRRAFEIDDTTPVAVFVGRFVEKKGMTTLQRMAAAMPDVTFLLAGWGPIDPKAWNLPNVRVLDGLAGASLAPLYQLSDALVLPSFGEGLPLVVQEATASGLAVLCGSDSVDGDPASAAIVTGLPVDPANPDETAATFGRALREILPHSRDGAEARSAFARARYDWSVAANRYLQVFDRVRAVAPRAPRQQLRPTPEAP